MTDRSNEIAKTFRHPFVQAAMVLLVAGVLMTAALGGFGKATRPTTLPTSGAGVRVDNDVLAFTPLCAWSSGARPGSPYPTPGNDYLNLRVRVENLLAKDSTRYLAKDLIWLPSGRGAPVEPDQAQRADDHTFTVQLQPHLPVTVDLVWKVPPGTAITRPGTWGVFGRKFQQDAYANGESAWVQDGPQSKLVLPVGTDCGEAPAQ